MTLTVLNLFDGCYTPGHAGANDCSTLMVCFHLSPQKINDPLHCAGFHLAIMLYMADNPARQSSLPVYFTFRKIV